MLANPLQNLSPSRRNLLLGLTLFVLAFGYRLIGIGWGLPNDLHNHSYHPDEPIILGYSQQVNPLAGDFDPGFYNYGTLYLTALRVAGDMATTYGGGVSETDPSSIYRVWGHAHLAGRLISALAGAGTVVLLFFMLRRFTNTLGAFLGASLVLVAPAHVVHSRFQTPDILATFLLTVSTFYALKLLGSREDESEAEVVGGEAGGHGGEKVAPASGTADDVVGVSSRWVMRIAVWAGVFAGLSAGTKYTGILGLLTLWAALWLSKKPSWWKAGLAGTGAALLAFVLSTPGVLLNTSKFMEDFKYELAHTATGHGLIFEGSGNGFSGHLFNLVIGLGLVLTVFAFGGLVIAAQKKHAWAFALLAFFVPYFILIGRADVLFIRYTFPLYIALAAGFGWIMGFAHERKGKWTALVVLGIAVLVGLDPFGGLRRSAVMTGWMAGEDSRDEAARYLKSAAVDNPDVAVGFVRDPWFWYPPLFKDSTMPRGRPSTLFEAMGQARAPRVVRYLPANPAEKQDWDIRLLTETKPEYVVLSSFDWEEGPRLIGKPGLSPVGQAMADASKAFGERLGKDYEVDRVFGKSGPLIHDLEYIRPNIQVWKRKDLKKP